MGAYMDIEVVYVDGLLNIQNLGVNCSHTFFRYELDWDSTVIQRPVLRLIRPRSSLARIDGHTNEQLATLLDPTKLQLNS